MGPQKESWLNSARIVTLLSRVLAFYFRRSGPQHRRSTQEPEKIFSHDVCRELIVVI
jgi:hypothetical protein